MGFSWSCRRPWVTCQGGQSLYCPPCVPQLACPPLWLLQTTEFSSLLEVKPGIQVCVVRAEASSLPSPQTAAALPPSPTPGLWAWSPGVQAGGRTSRPCFPARAGLGQDHSREGGGGPGLNKQAAGRHSHLGRNHTGLSFSRWEHLHGGGPAQAGPEGWVSRPRAGSWGVRGSMQQPLSTPQQVSSPASGQGKCHLAKH